MLKYIIFKLVTLVNKMKCIFLISSLFFCISLNAQNLKVIDSTSIAFKAKLLSINKQGVSDIKSMLDQVDNKQIKFLKTKYKYFEFLKIDFTDLYYEAKVYINEEDLIGQALFGSCSYYLAFNKVNAKYYKLGGFNDLDIDEFFYDLEDLEIFIFKDLEGGNEVEGIDMYCLYNYYNLKPKRRLKKGYNCFSKCSEEMSTEMGRAH